MRRDLDRDDPNSIRDLNPFARYHITLVCPRYPSLALLFARYSPESHYFTTLRTSSLCFFRSLDSTSRPFLSIVFYRCFSVALFICLRYPSFLHRERSPLFSQRTTPDPPHLSHTTTVSSTPSFLLFFFIFLPYPIFTRGLR